MGLRGIGHEMERLPGLHLPLARDHDPDVVARPGTRMHQRFRASFDIAELFLQQPKGFYFPELPNIEYADRAAFPWLDRVEAATDAIRAELLAVLEDDSAFNPYVEPELNRPNFNEKLAAMNTMAANRAGRAYSENK